MGTAVWWQGMKRDRVAAAPRNVCRSGRPQLRHRWGLAATAAAAPPCCCLLLHVEVGQLQLDIVLQRVEPGVGAAQP